MWRLRQRLKLVEELTTGEITSLVQQANSVNTTRMSASKPMSVGVSFSRFDALELQGRYEPAC